MLVLTPMAKGRGHGEYYLNLATEDYYLRGGEPPGYWAGEGATLLGLTGQVAPEDFRQIDQGYGRDGSPLVQNAGGARRPGWDATCTPPKSVSVVHALSPSVYREGIARDHRAAVGDMLEYLQRHAGTSRVGKGGTRQVPAKFVIAVFEHGTSRAQDPNLHSHCLIFNLGIRPDGSTGTILSRPIYRLKMAAGAVYRASLASRLRAHGWPITRTEGSFEIDGVPEEMCRHFSKRRARIVEGLKQERTNDPRVAAAISRRTRPKKEIVPRAELVARWKQDAKEFGFGDEQINAIKSQVGQADNETPEAIFEIAARTLAASTDHFEDQDFVRAVAEATIARSDCPVETIEKATELLHGQSSSRFFDTSGNERWVHPWFDRWIERLRERINRRARSKRHLVSDRSLRKAIRRTYAARKRSPLDKLTGRATSYEYTHEQLKAIRYVTKTRGTVKIITGVAGSGKTELLDTCRRAWEMNGLRVIGAAAGSLSSSVLQEKSGIESQPLWLCQAKAERTFQDVVKHHGAQILRAVKKRPTYQPDAFKLTDSTVLVVDNADAATTKEIDRLIRAVDQAGAKLVLVGQAPETNAPNAMKALSDSIDHVDLQETHRFSEKEPADSMAIDWRRQAATELRDGNQTEALRHFAEQGHLKISQSLGALELEIVSAWSKEGLKCPKDNVILSDSKEQAARLNETCQKARQFTGDVGILGHEIVESSRSTLALGDRVICDRKSLRYDVDQGDLGTITRISKFPFLHALTTIDVSFDNGQVKQIDLEKYPHVSLGYALSSDQVNGLSVEKSFVSLAGQTVPTKNAHRLVTASRGAPQIFAVQEDFPELKAAIHAARSKENPQSLQGIEKESVARDPSEILKDRLRFFETKRSRRDRMSQALEVSAFRTRKPEP